MLALSQAVQSHMHGSPVLAYEPVSEAKPADIIDLDDCREVYLDSLDLFPFIEERCDYSPSGQCEYGGPQDRECKWCRRPSGLDK